MFRFTIRDVLWLTALVAVLAAWWVDHSIQSALSNGLNAAYFEMEGKLESLGYTVDFDEDGEGVVISGGS